MRLSRPFSILTIGLLVCSVRLHADDLCAIRPDLCKGAVKSKKKKSNRNYHSETAREADELEREIILEEQERRTKKAQHDYNGFTKERPDSHNNFEEAPPKPLGFSQVRKADKSHQAMRDFGKRRPRSIDRETANTFDAYLNSNSQNPALNSRMPSSQNAFQPSKWGTHPGTIMKTEPMTSGGGFNQGQGPYPQNGGFSSKPVTLEQPQSAPVSGETSQSSTGESPVPPAGSPSEGEGAGPLN